MRAASLRVSATQARIRSIALRCARSAIMVGDGPSPSMATSLATFSVKTPA